MTRTIFGAALALLLGTTPLYAQMLLPPVAPSQAMLGPPVVDCGMPPVSCGPYRVWGGADYLMWWVKNAPLPVPLVTTGDPTVGLPTTNSAGAIGQMGTKILLGDSSVDFREFSGGRFVLGVWLDREAHLGFEVSGFLLENRSSQFNASSDALGYPPLYFPAFNVQAGAERGNPISDPLRLFSGNVSVTSTLQLWGAELNEVFCVIRKPGLEMSFLLGFRYADLTEGLHINNTTNDLLLVNTTVANDYFDTRNQFYGGQLGVRTSFSSGRFTLDVTAKAALGVTHQVVDVEGNISQFGPGAITPGSFNGGVYSQPTNIGRRSADEFTVIPSGQLKLAYQITPNLRAFAGYDFMYWNQVVRPGNQIDHNINESQSPVFGTGTLSGSAAPAPLFLRTDFWAQGVSFGLEFRY